MKKLLMLRMGLDSTYYLEISEYKIIEENDNFIICLIKNYTCKILKSELLNVNCGMYEQDTYDFIHREVFSLETDLEKAKDLLKKSILDELENRKKIINNLSEIFYKKEMKIEIKDKLDVDLVL